MEPFHPVVPIQCAVQNYIWGKVGNDSTVAKLAKLQPGFDFDDKMTYAELWMGTHPARESKVLTDELVDNGLYLGDWIKSHPSTLGNNVREKFGVTLPYLFKVLSINKALSIQAHPSKAHAEVLHRERPDIYGDPNHKPEMAIALTTFEGLCGFRPACEILGYFHEVRELLEVVGQDAVNELINAEMATEQSCRKDAVEKALKRCMSCLLERDAEMVKLKLSNLVERLNECHYKREDTKAYLGRLILRLHEQFPGDIGCFCIYFLNVIQLEPFESIFFLPNVPHAYLSGDIVEVMASSNNVVRAGFTHKYKDVKTLLEMLNYTSQTVEETKFRAVQDEDDRVWLYNAPVDDFSVKKIQISVGSCVRYDFKPINGPSIILALSGQAKLQHGTGSTDFHRGTAVFVSSNEEISLQDINQTEEVLLFQAYCDLEPPTS